MSKKREKGIVSFQDSENNMLIISERRTGEDKASHDMRIEMMKKVITEEKSRGTRKSNFGDLISKYLVDSMAKYYKSKN